MAVTTSQFGEEEMIDAAMRKLPPALGWCVEFGAWDGVNLSNVCGLVRDKGWRAVMIEANRGKFEELCRNHPDRTQVHALNAVVGWRPGETLDDLLDGVPDFPDEYDVLSVDIDGCDYYVWKAAARRRARLVCIEFNPTMADEVDYVQPPDSTMKIGASLLTLVKLAREKGYELVATTRNNALFVPREYFDRFQMEDNSIRVLRTDREWVTHMFSGMDGSLHAVGHGLNPWNGVPIQRLLRRLPWLTRGFPVEMPWWRRKLLGAWKKLGPRSRIQKRKAES